MTTGKNEERDNVTDKKKWGTPLLRVFTSTRTEERILANCKHSYQSFSGPEGRNNICTVYVSCIGRCSTEVGS